MRPLVLAVWLSATPAFADESVVAVAPRPTLAVDALAVVPVGDYANAASVGGGAAARFEVPLGPVFATACAGIVGNVMRTSSSLTMLPLYAGVRVPLGASGAYAAGELGMTYWIGGVSSGYGSASSSDTRFGLAAWAGYRRRTLDLRAGLFAPDAGNALAVIASAGIDVAAF
jgi:hypothetical protein